MNVQVQGRSVNTVHENPCLNNPVKTPFNGVEGKTSKKKGKRSFLFLDRDGVINHDKKGYVTKVTDFRLISGSARAIARASKRGYIINVCTIQPALSEGLMTAGALEAVHLELRKSVSRYGGNISNIYYCPHTYTDNCYYRKPSPGQLEAIAYKYKMSQSEVSNSWMIGDNYRDIRAGLNFGAKSALVRTGNGEKVLKENQLPNNVAVFKDLAEAVKVITAEQIDGAL